MTPRQRTANYEYAAVQGLYWASCCGSASFAAVYLQGRGFSNLQLGQVLAIGFVLGFLFPQLLATLIDRSRRVNVFLCQFGVLFLQAVTAALLLIFSSLTAVFVICCLLIALEITLNPMNTLISVELENRIGNINYGAARGTGSLVYSFVAVALGYLVERRGFQILPWVNLFFIVLQALMLAVLSRSVRYDLPAEPKIVCAGSQRYYSDFFRENRRFFGLLPGIVLLFFAQNLVTNYLINVVREVGGDTSDMGRLSGYDDVPVSQTDPEIQLRRNNPFCRGCLCRKSPGDRTGGQHAQPVCRLPAAGSLFCDDDARHGTLCSVIYRPAGFCQRAGSRLWDGYPGKCVFQQSGRAAL